MFGYPDGGSGYGDRPLLWADNDVVVFGDESTAAGWSHVVAMS